MKTNIILWGTGMVASTFEQFVNYDKTVIVAYVDNNKVLWGKKRIVRKNDVNEILIIEPGMLKRYMEETESSIIICASAYEKIRIQLKALEIDAGQIIDGFHIVGYEYDKRLKNILLPNYFVDVDNFYIEGFKVKFNAKSVPQYRKQYPMYDAIFPYLALLEQNIMCEVECETHWIIDIGANVGDSVLGMLKNTTGNILAVEPVEAFYTLMQENFRSLDACYANRIRTVQAYISNDESERFCSTVRRGTASKILCENSEVSTLSVQTLLERNNIERSAVGLIKVDTDGFDADCIMSCGEILSINAPLLYWENQIETFQQYQKYMQLSTYLKKNGYNSYFVFDNFGNYIGCMDFELLENLNRYMARINSRWGARTFDYVDILACKEWQKEKVREAIGIYLNNYPVNRYVET